MFNGPLVGEIYCVDFTVESHARACSLLVCTLQGHVSECSAHHQGLEFTQIECFEVNSLLCILEWSLLGATFLTCSTLMKVSSVISMIEKQGRNFRNAASGQVVLIDPYILIDIGILLLITAHFFKGNGAFLNFQHVFCSLCPYL